MRILVLQGPNLNLLGTRQPEIYGGHGLASVQARLDAAGQALGVTLRHQQHNGEGALIDAVQQAASDGLDGALVNAGAYTHTSVALRDALVGTGLPFVEVHISNVYAREPFRHRSLLSDVAQGIVVGFGVAGYELGLKGLVDGLRGAGAAR